MKKTTEINIDKALKPLILNTPKEVDHNLRRDAVF
jgi:hypothetical protein